MKKKKQPKKKGVQVIEIHIYIHQVPTNQITSTPTYPTYPGTTPYNPINPPYIVTC